MSVMLDELLTADWIKDQRQRTKMTDEQLDQVILMVGVIRHGLKMGNAELRTALGYEPTDSVLPQITLHQLELVVTQPELVQICRDYAPQSITSACLTAGQNFVQAYDYQGSTPKPVVIWLDHMTVYELVQGGKLSIEQMMAANQLIMALSQALSRGGYPAFASMRARMPQPPKIDPITHRPTVSNLMLAETTDGWHELNELREHFPDLATGTNIRAARELLKALPTA